MGIQVIVENKDLFATGLCAIENVDLGNFVCEKGSDECYWESDYQELYVFYNEDGSCIGQFSSYSDDCFMVDFKHEDRYFNRGRLKPWLDRLGVPYELV